MVAPRHAVDLPNRHMAFIDKEQRIFGQIFKQSWRRLPR
jgi:hypothetical protein